MNHLYHRCKNCDLIWSELDQTQIIIDIPNNELENINRHNQRTNNSEKCKLPLFIISISIIEIIIFLYDLLITGSENNIIKDLSSDSLLIYRPDKRYQIWRFISYMLIHVNWFHLVFNIVVQLVIGLRLEISHGCFRVGFLYFAGGLAGSLATSICDPYVFLVGASGGVYALFAANISNILFNYEKIRHSMLEIILVFFFVIFDFVYSIYTVKFNNHQLYPPVSFVAHLFGFIAGLTLGLLILKEFNIKTSFNLLLWWLILGIVIGFVIFGIIFNILNSVAAQIIEEETKELITKLLKQFKKI